jgi:thiol-disulfide isomerase/thioredoxin
MPFPRAALYLALTLAANGVAAQDWSAVEALREGDMQKLHFAEPVAAPETVFHNAHGEELTLAAYHGQWVVLNFWATWCAPCRVEMPTLSTLQAEMGGETFQVVTIATGRNDPMEMAAFFEEIGVHNLPLHNDPRQHLARDFGVLGLPATIILNPEGQEVARLLGDAHWDSPSAMAIVAHLTGQ